LAECLISQTAGSQEKFQSVLQLIVKNRIEEFGHDELFKRLVWKKWEKFGRSLYVKTTILPFVALLLLHSVTIAVRGIEVERVWREGVPGCPAPPEECAPVPQERRTAVVSCAPAACFTDLQSGDGQWQAASFILEMVTTGGGMLLMLYKAWKLRRVSRADLTPGEGQDWTFSHTVDVVFRNFPSILSLSTFLFLTLTLVCRVLGLEDYEMAFFASSAVAIWFLALALCLPFQAFGVVVITMYRMFVGDVLKFLIVFFTTTLAYSFAMYALMQQARGESGEINNMDGHGGSLLALIWVAFGEVELTDQYNLARASFFTEIVTLTYIILQALLLLNLLIAMMLETFQKSTMDVERTWIFPFAELVLRYEEMLTPEQRAKPSYRCGTPQAEVQIAGTDDGRDGDKQDGEGGHASGPEGKGVAADPAKQGGEPNAAGARQTVLNVLRAPARVVSKLLQSRANELQDEVLQAMSKQWATSPFFEMIVEKRSEQDLELVEQDVKDKPIDDYDKALQDFKKCIKDLGKISVKVSKVSEPRSHMDGTTVIQLGTPKAS